MIIDEEVRKRMLDGGKNSMERFESILHETLEGRRDRMLVGPHSKYYLRCCTEYTLMEFIGDHDREAAQEVLRKALELFYEADKIKYEERHAGKQVIKDYDPCAVNDIDLADSLVQSPNCREYFLRFDYGDYLGLQELNSIQGVLMRILRAWFHNDIARIRRELHSLTTLRISRDQLTPFFEGSKAMWYELLESLFMAKDKEGFEKAYRRYYRWHKQRATKKFITPGGISPDMSFNYVLAVLGRIAKEDLGWNWIKDEFVPEAVRN